jgi:hypothetical protein
MWYWNWAKLYCRGDWKRCSSIFSTNVNRITHHDHSKDKDVCARSAKVADRDFSPSVIRSNDFVCVLALKSTPV